MDCYSAKDLDILAANRQAFTRHISQWGWDNHNPKRDETKNTILQDANYIRALDSMFSIAKEFIIEQIGEEAFCKRAKFGGISMSYSNYKKEKIRGTFGFQVHYEPIVCWTGWGQPASFSFKETEKGKYEMTFPEPFPKSILEGSRPKLRLHADVVNKALGLGLIDGTENIKVERAGEWDREVVLISNDGFDSQIKIFFDSQTGELLRDTLLDIYKTYRRMSLADYLKASEKVVDATCIKTEEFKGANNHRMYTNYFFETHHVVKGGKMNPSFVTAASQMVTSHGGNNMPAPGTRSLLFLKRENPEVVLNYRLTK
ncbi:MAG: hypothetical protein ACI9N1_000337 [Flavobacteriales bacterium]|jgi:hypothetical protein